LPSVTFHRTDAYQFVETDHHYDIVFIDLFEGDRAPGKFTSKRFIANLRHLTHVRSTVIINFGYIPESDLRRAYRLYQTYFTSFQAYALQNTIIGVISRDNETYPGVRIV